MQKILDELYASNVDFSSGHYGPDSEFAKATQKKRESMNKLMDLLDGNGKELFEKYCEAVSDIEEIRRYNTFVRTLRFGVLLMVEVLEGEEG